ncbi:MAG TPA: hypothetical protein VGM30_10530 [Puia sp.]|jgi:hypothetical protein
MKELEYRTYDELLSSVLSDFKTYDQEGMIDPQDLIKVAQSINKELSVKINPLKELVLDLTKGKVRLPNDFYLLNFALLCGKYEKSIPILHGIHTEDVLLPADCNNPGPIPGSTYNTTCRPAINEAKVRLTQCGEGYGVVQYFKYETRTYHHFLPLRMESSSKVSTKCPNLGIRSERLAYIKGGWLYTNFDSGTLYINYMGNMEDDEGNLLVLDHAIVNTYYEYALKERILENMLIEGEQVGELLKLMGIRRKNARLEARNVVFTPDFAELKEAWEANRKVQHNRYFRMFEDICYAV